MARQRGFEAPGFEAPQVDEDARAAQPCAPVGESAPVGAGDTGR